MSDQVLLTSTQMGSGQLSEARILDPFDPARLRLDSNYTDQSGVKKILNTVPVIKPNRETFVRVHPDQSYRLDTSVMELKQEKEIYLVDPGIRDALASEATVSNRRLFTTMNRQGILSIWPVRLPGPDGKIDTWSSSAMEAANLAMSKWVRVTSNMDLGAYEIYEAISSIPDPKWPVESFQELLRIAFRDRLIGDLNHPVLKRLRGEI